jgi:hypothetical protein
MSCALTCNLKYGVCNNVTQICECVAYYHGPICNELDISSIFPVHYLLTGLWALVTIWTIIRCINVALAIPRALHHSPNDKSAVNGYKLQMTALISCVLFGASGFASEFPQIVHWTIDEWPPNGVYTTGFWMVATGCSSAYATLRRIVTPWATVDPHVATFLKWMDRLSLVLLSILYVVAIIQTIGGVNVRLVDNAAAFLYGLTLIIGFIRALQLLSTFTLGQAAKARSTTHLLSRNIRSLQVALTGMLILLLCVAVVSVMGQTDIGPYLVIMVVEEVAYLLVCFLLAVLMGRRPSEGKTTPIATSGADHRPVTAGAFTVTSPNSPPLGHAKQLKYQHSHYGTGRGLSNGAAVSHAASSSYHEDPMSPTSPLSPATATAIAAGGDPKLVVVRARSSHDVAAHSHHPPMKGRSSGVARSPPTHGNGNGNGNGQPEVSLHVASFSPPPVMSPTNPQQVTSSST